MKYAIHVTQAFEPGQPGGDEVDCWHGYLDENGGLVDTMADAAPYDLEQVGGMLLSCSVSPTQLQEARVVPYLMIHWYVATLTTWVIVWERADDKTTATKKGRDQLQAFYRWLGDCRMIHFEDIKTVRPATPEEVARTQEWLGHNPTTTE